MNRDKSGYTIIYASIMVIIVALGLAFTHQTLKDTQTRNVNTDKMQQILRSPCKNTIASDHLPQDQMPLFRNVAQGVSGRDQPLHDSLLIQTNIKQKILLVRAVL